jgi:hypothetical protein
MKKNRAKKTFKEDEDVHLFEDSISSVYLTHENAASTKAGKSSKNASKDGSKNGSKQNTVI